MVESSKESKESKRRLTSSAQGPEQSGLPGKGHRTVRRRRAAAESILAGSVAVAAVAVVTIGSIVPGFTAAAVVDPPAVALPAGQSTAACPGPARLLDGSAAGTDPQFSATSSSSSSTVTALVLSAPDGTVPGSALSPLGAGEPLALVAKASASGSVSPSAVGTAGATAGSAGIADHRKAAVLKSQAVAGASVLRADSLGDKRASLGAVMAYAAPDGDLAGLAAGECQPPANDLWLAGASTTVGRTAILQLSNSSQTAATVNLDLFGDKGPVPAPGAKGLLVPPGTSRSVVLAGLAAGQSNLSMRLKSTGGPVAATIQQSVLRGLTPGGVEVISPVSAPAARQVITGVAIQQPALAAAVAGQPGYADAGAALQVTVPGSADALVQVKVYGPSGQQQLPGGGVFTAKAGGVSELSLTGLPAGTYTLDVGSDVAFTATARVASALKTGEPIDFGSAGAGGKLGDGQLITVPQGVLSTLAFGVPAGRAKVSLTPVSLSGGFLPVKTVDVAGGTTQTVDSAQLAGAAVAGFVVSATGDAVYGAQILGIKDKAAVSVLGVPRGVAGPQDLKVILGY
ncbi:DUF5719 family protein [Arthrobacter sp. H14-L1]|uniref:DUF5719 family protein n=1 Tax=Arthrobacter sp. H14-L1 TaxID=2996697 RepID=UPI0022720DD1|nr:DUF5719 family protein [Arthrobacter sp. H14-L1]MCY0904938.1 DUF5719 family protein [Arthrobacter sp. H14-L1]